MEKPNNDDLPFKKKYLALYWEDFTTSNTSEEKSSNVCKKIKSYDFAFVMKPVKVLKNALEALCDRKFNTKEEAVIRVEKDGCEIEVSGNGYLGLKATGLEDFQCKKSFRKMFHVSGIAEMFKSAVKYEEDSVFVYVEEGSNKLSFQWGHNNLADFGFGVPITLGLKDVDPEVKDFPKCLSYGFEAVLQSSVLRRMSIRLQKPRRSRPKTVEVTMQTATVSISTGGKDLASTMEFQDQVYIISAKWKYWESFESASQTAAKASVYLITTPKTGIMVRFHLDQLGDLVFFHNAVFTSVPVLPFLGHFRTVN